MAKPKTKPVTIDHVDRMTADHGWFRERLIFIESMIWGRYAWWLSCLLNGTLGGPENAIPRVPFANTISDQPGPTVEGIDAETIGNRAGAKSMIERVFNRSYDSGAHLKDIIDWWLWAFGDPSVERKPAIPDHAAITQYTGLELHKLIAHPADWMALIAGDYYSKGSKKRSGWFATPIEICNLLAEMTIARSDGDTRRLTFQEPCVGTGPIILAASNYLIDMRANDIDPTMVSACRFNCWLYVPWMVIGDKMSLIEFKIDAMKKILFDHNGPQATPETPKPQEKGQLNLF